MSTVFWRPLYKGPYTNYIDKHGGEGFAKCLCYYISLCSKLVYGGERGVKNLQNLVYVRSLCTYGPLAHFVYEKNPTVPLLYLENRWTPFENKIIINLVKQEYSCLDYNYDTYYRMVQLQLHNIQSRILICQILLYVF